MTAPPPGRPFLISPSGRLLAFSRPSRVRTESCAWNAPEDGTGDEAFPGAAALKAGPGWIEPSVLNRTLVFTWPGGKERDLVFSEAE
jgi:hypothetical protein